MWILSNTYVYLDFEYNCLGYVSDRLLFLYHYQNLIVNRHLYYSSLVGFCCHAINRNSLFTFNFELFQFGLFG